MTVSLIEAAFATAHTLIAEPNHMRHVVALPGYHYISICV
jgi:hypothetical protein